MSEVDGGQTAAGIDRDGRFSAHALLDAALTIVAEEGLGSLTLRPLAKRLGVSVASLTRQIGSKDQLIDHLADLAARADEADLVPWLHLVQFFDTLPCDALIEITEDVLRLRVEAGRLRSRFKCELVQAAAFNVRLQRALAAWCNVDHRFWQALAQRCETPLSFDIAAALSAFAIDDAAHALLIDHYHGYRWVRREGIRRLWHDLFAGPSLAASRLFEHAFSEEPSTNGMAVWTVRTLTNRHDKAFGEIIAAIIMDSGTEAITHREVARRAGMPHTSVAYHYPLQDDLVDLGMQAVVELVRQEALAAASRQQLPAAGGPLAYASFAIALAAVSRPNLRPIVRELRRRRGENLLPWLRMRVPHAPNINIANVQTMSSVVIGAILLERAGVRPAAPLPGQLFAQLGI